MNRANLKSKLSFVSVEKNLMGDVFMDVVHEYPDLTVHLTLFNATIANGEPKKLEHNDIKWITPEEIPNYDFCPADVEILKKIIEFYEVG